jgi:SAM-dependent methyltransferase
MPILKFSKSYKNILKLKSDFYSSNDLYLKNTLVKKKILRKQKRRKNCKNCYKKIYKSELIFTCHTIDYFICNKCGHFNGLYEDTDRYVKLLYKDDKDQTYSKVYLNNYKDRVKNIYNPKMEFLINVIGKNHRIIDVGCGAGYFLKSLENKNIYADGYESNLKLVNFGNQILKKNKIYHSELEETYKTIGSGNYSVLSLIGVLEHLQKPNVAIKNFVKSDIEFIYISVPLFSLSSFLDTAYQDVFPRQLTADHTHLYTKESIYWFAKNNNLKIAGEWWFGTDFADIFRSIVVSTNIKNKKNYYKYFDKYFFNQIDDFQKILDKNKICSEVHIVFQKS